MPERPLDKPGKVDASSRYDRGQIILNYYGGDYWSDARKKSYERDIKKCGAQLALSAGLLASEDGFPIGVGLGAFTLAECIINFLGNIMAPDKQSNEAIHNVSGMITPWGMAAALGTGFSGSRAIVESSNLANSIADFIEVKNFESSFLLPGAIDALQKLQEDFQAFRQKYEEEQSRYDREKEKRRDEERRAIDSGLDAARNSNGTSTSEAWDYTEKPGSFRDPDMGIA